MIFKSVFEIVVKEYYIRIYEYLEEGIEDGAQPWKKKSIFFTSYY